MKKFSLLIVLLMLSSSMVAAGFNFSKDVPSLFFSDAGVAQ